MIIFGIIYFVAICFAHATNVEDISQIPTLSTNKLALIDAVMNGQVDRAKILCASGVDVNEAIWEGKTAVMWAAENGSLEMVKLLFESGANIRVQDSSRITRTIPSRTYEVYNFLKHQESELEYNFAKAVKESNYEQAKLLIRQGADVNTTSYFEFRRDCCSKR